MLLLDNECNKMRNPESLLEFVSSPHFPAPGHARRNNTGEHNWTAVAAWVIRGVKGDMDLTLLVLSFLLLSAED